MRPTFEDFKKEALKNPDIKKEYDELKPIFKLKKHLISTRLKKGLTQAEVAKKMKTSKSAISRLESVTNTCVPNLSTLIKYAKALECEIEISLKS